jgi:hypothetical protein
MAQLEVCTSKTPLQCYTSRQSLGWAVLILCGRYNKLQVSVIESYIRQIGLAPTKAKNISKMSKVGICDTLFSMVKVGRSRRFYKIHATAKFAPVRLLLRTILMEAAQGTRRRLQFSKVQLSACEKGANHWNMTHARWKGKTINHTGWRVESRSVSSIFLTVHRL